METSLTSTNPFIGKYIAVLGDVMVDRFIYGDVERISPEAPVPVVKVSHRKTHLGGAANVAANLKSLGASPLMIGRIGADSYGHIFKECAKEEGISTEFLIESNTVPTTSKCRIIARTQQVVRFDEEETLPFTQKQQQNLLNVLKAVREKTSIIIVSDYAKGLLNADVFSMVKDLWSDGLILLDPKPVSALEDEKYNHVHFMKPNLSEACKMLGEKNKPKTDEDVAEMATKLIARYNLKGALITRSGDGMTLAIKDQKTTHLKTITQEVIDVSGAGDTVIATYSAAIASGYSHEEASALANKAGGIIVSKLGTALITWEDLQK